MPAMTSPYLNIAVGLVVAKFGLTIEAAMQLIHDEALDGGVSAEQYAQHLVQAFDEGHSSSA
jgi:hypothetical protein